jgi:ribonuclease P protein component
MRETYAEANLAAQGPAPPARPRIPGPDENQRRARRPQSPAAQGPASPRRIAGVEPGARPWRAGKGMYKKNRLRDNATFRSIRRDGRTLLHPLLVMSWLPNGLEYSRFGFSVGRRIGTAVQRNRVKRWMREAVRLRIKNHETAAGWDVVFVARYPMREASFHQADQAIGLMLRRAELAGRTE